MVSQHLLLGVDVGNSKTHVAVADTGGRVLSVVEGPGGSPQWLGFAGSWALVTALTAAALDAAGLAPGTRVAAAAYALAGVDFPSEEQAYAAVSGNRPADRSVIWNDTFAVLRAGTAGPDGIAVVAGAGINCVGRWGPRSVRYPSLGRISGDWGGGAELGREALALACRDEDGRGAPTVLARQVPAYFGLERPSQVTLALHRGEFAEARLVPLARLVLTGADGGDPGCLALVTRLAEEVVTFVRATADRLGAPVQDLPVVLGGGLLRAGSRSLDELVAGGLDGLHAGLRAHVGPGPPVVGALLLAADLLGGPAPAAAALADAVAGYLSPPDPTAPARTVLI